MIGMQSTSINGHAPIQLGNYQQERVYGRIWSKDPLLRQLLTIAFGFENVANLDFENI